MNQSHAETVAEWLRVHRSEWLPYAFPDGRSRNGTFFIGDQHGTAGKSLPIEIDGSGSKTLKDFGGDWAGDDLDLWAQAVGGLTIADAIKHAAQIFKIELPAVSRINGHRAPEPEPEPNGATFADPPPAHPTLGNYADLWEYHRNDGRHAFWVCRFDSDEVDAATGKRKKEFRPFANAKWADPPGPLPLYRLPDLVAHPDAPVVVVEGEKTCDAAIELLHHRGCVVTTWAHGAGSVHKSDWSPLKGRDVVCWPDNDDSGVEAMKHAAQLMLDAGARSVRIVELPKGLPPKWDLADPLPDGLTMDAVERLIDNAPAFEPEPRQAEPEAEADDTGIDMSDVIVVSDWRGIEPPPRRWVVPHWIPQGYVTGIYGAGGVGKTQLILQLANSVATGTTWVGLPISETARVFAWFCEDGEDELQRRQADFIRHARIDYSDRFALESRLGKDNVLAAPNKLGIIQTTSVFDELRAKVKKFGAQFVLLDTVADIFGGNENIRTQVRLFLTTCLGRLAIEIGGSVAFTAHPSQAGLRDDSGQSGSTAWEGGVRARLYFSRPKKDGKDDTQDTRARILHRKKANYADLDSIELHWENGVFIRDDDDSNSVAGKIKRRNDKAEVKRRFLEQLDKHLNQGRSVSASPNASTYAPKVFTNSTGISKAKTRSSDGGTV